MRARGIGFVLSLVAVTPAVAAAADAKPSIAVLVETTAGGPALASSIETALAPQASRVVSASEVRAALQFVSVPRPVDDAGAAVLRHELGVDAILGVSTKVADDGGLFLMVRVAEEGRVMRRFAATTRDSIAAEAARLVAELRFAAPVPPATPAPAATPRAAATALPDPISFEVPARSITLTDPPFSQLLGSEVLLLGTNGSYYKGRVVAANDATLEIQDAVARRSFRRGSVKTVKTLRTASVPVVATERVVVTLAKESVEGTVLEATDRTVLLETGTGSSRRFDWSDVIRVDVPAQRRTPSELLDPAEAGLTPEAIHQPKPPYPEKARFSNTTGLVVVEITVDVTGSVVRAEIVRSSPLFDESALETVRKWRYKPLVLEGKPIAWRTKINLRFELTDGRNKKKTEWKPHPIPPQLGPRFGEAGTKIASAGFGYVDSWTRLEVEGSGSRYESVSVFASLGYAFFPVRGVEVELRPFFQRYATLYGADDWTRDDSFGLSIGAARLFRLSESLFAGPQVTAGFFVTRSTADAAGPAFHVSQSGRAGTIGALIHLPIGRSGVASIVADYFVESSDLDLRQGSATGSGGGRRSGFETSFRLGFWWPRR